MWKMVNNHCKFIKILPESQSTQWHIESPLTRWSSHTYTHTHPRRSRENFSAHHWYESARINYSTITCSKKKRQRTCTRKEARECKSVQIEVNSKKSDESSDTWETEEIARVSTTRTIFRQWCTADWRARQVVPRFEEGL